MWSYDKKLEYPIKIKKQDPKMAKVIISQYGGPDGELGAALRYLSQRFTMITPEAKATLNDIGTEELAHLEMIGTMCKQLTENASVDDIEKAGLAPYYTDHDKAIYPASAAGVPFTAAYLQSKGDPITDLYEDMAAEQKARSTYEYLINLATDPDVIEPLKFLREREVVHFQRFGEALRKVQDYMQNKKRFSMPGKGMQNMPMPGTAGMQNTPMQGMAGMQNMSMPGVAGMQSMPTQGTTGMQNMPMQGTAGMQNMSGMQQSMHNMSGMHNMPNMSAVQGMQNMGSMHNIGGMSTKPIR